MTTNTGGPDDKCYEVVSDVMVNSPLQQWCGDLFVMTKRLVYVRLAFVEMPEGGLAGARGDPLKVIGIRNMKQETLTARDNARASAREARAGDFGLPLESRMKRATVVSRQDVKALKLHTTRDSRDLSAIELVMTDRSGFLLMEDKTASEVFGRLQSWMIGKPIEVDCDRQGLDLRLPLHDELLAWVANPVAYPRVTLDDCTRAANTVPYCEALGARLKKRAFPERERFCQLLRSCSMPLASGIGVTMARLPGGHWTEGAAVVCGIFAALGLVAGWSMRSEADTHLAGGIVGLVGTGLAVAALAALALALRERRRNKQLAAMLLGDLPNLNFLNLNPK